MAALFAIAGGMSGCSSVATRFLVRTVERLGTTPEPVSGRLSHPILARAGLSVLWIGHASMLLQIHDKVFLTDPVLTTTVGLLARRSVEPGLDPASIDRVDFTLISHLHFDHFSYGSLGMLPTNGRLLVPPGGTEYTPEFGFAETIEAAWWQTIERDSVRITPVPVRHFGGRYGFDIALLDKRSYTGYIIEYRGITLLFAGDTAYDPELFRELGRRWHIDVACIPIAPVEPREYMKNVHADPAEALQIFEDTGARLMIPMHYQTFFQGLDPAPDHAERLLADAVRERHLEGRVLPLRIGEQRMIIPE
jgi:L-ascorbate metabolism protein UlaG (beta-lactamase superfamily)